MRQEKRILFCWSGGGLPGLDIHVGIWKALCQFGIASTANAGTSAGAIVAAFNSFGHTPAQAENIIRNLDDGDVRDERALWKLRISFVDSFLSHGPIAELLKRYLPPEFAELEKPLSVFVTNEDTGRSGSAQRGSLYEAVLASMSIAGVFPPIHSETPDGAPLVLSDGGTTANLPIPEDLETFDEVYLLVAKRPLDYQRRRKGILSRLMYNIDLLLEDQTNDAIASARSRHPHVHVIRPPVRAPRGSLHFDHRLIDEAFTFACHELAEDSHT